MEKLITNTVEVIPDVKLINAVGFMINSAQVLPTEMANIANVAAVLKANPGMNIAIKGYADAGTGTPEYNAVLADKRAHAVYDALVDMGVDSDQLAIDRTDGAQPYDTNNWNRVVLFELK